MMQPPSSPIDEARAILIRLGRKKFGEPTKAVEARIVGITDLDHLSALLDRVLEDATWDELLATPVSESD